MERRRFTAPRVAEEEEEETEERRAAREGYDRCPEIKGLRPPSEIKLTNRGNESLVRPLLASAPRPDARFFHPVPLFSTKGVVVIAMVHADSNSRKSDAGRRRRHALDPAADDGRGGGGFS